MATLEIHQTSVLRTHLPHEFARRDAGNVCRPLDDRCDDLADGALDGVEDDALCRRVIAEEVEVGGHDHVDGAYRWRSGGRYSEREDLHREHDGIDMFIRAQNAL